MVAVCGLALAWVLSAGCSSTKAPAFDTVVDAGKDVDPGPILNGGPDADTMGFTDGQGRFELMVARPQATELLGKQRLPLGRRARAGQELDLAQRQITCAYSLPLARREQACRGALERGDARNGQERQDQRGQ